MDREGDRVDLLGEEAEYGALELSPDGGRAAVVVLDRASGNRDVWLFDLARGVRTRLTSGLRDVRALTWAPDGGRLAFRSAREGRFDLYQAATDGASREQRLWSDTLSKYPSSWSPDGRFILYHTGMSTPETGEDLWVLPLAGARRPFPFVRSSFSEQEGRFSPDGRWVVYQSDESGRSEVYVVPFPARGGKWRISTGGGRAPRWRRDGTELFYLAPGDTLMAAAVDGRDSTFRVGVVRPLFAAPRLAHGYEWDVAADGRRFLLNASADVAGTPITLVLNWPAALSRPP
jgi:Tol biopolymer transport system component